MYKGMLVLQLSLDCLHLSSLIFFALKYLRFDVKSSNKPISIDDLESYSNIKTALKSISEMKIDGNRPPSYDRMVFFMLDAWRWDFLFSERTEMKFLKT